MEEIDICNETMDENELKDNVSGADYLKMFPDDSKIFNDISLNKIMGSLAVNSKEPSDADLLKMYPHDLQMYQDPLTGHVSLEEFEKLGSERLEVLRIIDRLSKQIQVKSEEVKECLLSALKCKELDYYIRLITSPGCDSNTVADIETRRKDQISHFVLRFSLYRSIKTLRWFIELEERLFSIRFSSLNTAGIEKFLVLHGLNYPTLSEEEKNENRENLLAVHGDIDINSTVFYKVPYLQALTLVKNRKIYINRGTAFVPITDISHVLSQYFEEFLHKEINSIESCLVKEDRLEPIFKNFLTFTEEVILQEPDSVPIDSLDKLAETSYPLCMKTMHQGLRANHHLKNGARFQYGVFLKLIGISYQSQVDFFKEEFLQNMNLQTFERSYQYNIKHIYGKVGCRLEYTRLSCKSVIESRVGFGEYHGCPYKNMTKDTLRFNLKKMDIEEEGIEEIENLAKDERYREACTKCFQFRYKTPLADLIESPPNYFFQSQNLFKKERKFKEKLKKKQLLEKEKEKEKEKEVAVENPAQATLEVLN